MHSLRALWFRLTALLRRKQLEAEMAEEMRQHLERRVQEKVADGISPADAHYAAQREFGGLARVQEQCRDEQRFVWLEQCAQDVRYAFRQLRRNPGFAATAIATLALGVGLNTAIFSVAYGVLWRPLPYPAPDRLVAVASAQQTETGPKTLVTWTPSAYAALRARVTSVEHLAAYSSITAQLTGCGEPRQLRALEVSPNFFSTLGVAPSHGRTFITDASAAADDDRSVIVTDQLWRSVLQADPAIVGRPLIIDGIPRTVIAVLPADFSFRPATRSGSLPEPEIFLANRWPADPGAGAFLFLLGRLKAGVTREAATAEFSALANDPAIMPAGALTQAGAFAANARTFARIIGLQENGAAPTRTLLLILLGAVSFVQLIACLNVANLQMARLSARRDELSVRMALGAGRRRIMRQLLTEAVVLSLLGTTLGVGLAQLATHLIVPLIPPFALPRLGGIVIDGEVLAFCLCLAVVSTLLVGFVPALRVGGAAFGPGVALHTSETRTTGDRQGERLRSLLVAAQIAMTLILLIGAGLLIHSFVRLTSVSPGFESSGRDGVVQVVRVTLPRHLYDKPERIHAFAHGVLERIERLPGVKSASVINSAPFGMMFIRDKFQIEGQPNPTFSAGKPKIEPGYFKTMGIRLLAGRDFTARDAAEAPKVAILSERIVREYFPRGPSEALGRRVRFDEHSEWMTVVGVVADVRQMGLDQEVQPMLYAPFEQDRSDLVRFVAFVARTTIPASVAEGIRTEIRGAAPDLAIETTVTMDDAVTASLVAPRFRMLLLGLFAATATLIATCGIYGLMAYAVTQRRREIGVRMALGAARGDVLRLVLARAFRIVAVGLVVGLAGAAVVTRVLQRFLFAVTATDPVVYVGVTLLLIAVGLLAAWLPARRAANVDPMMALRCE